MEKKKQADADRAEKPPKEPQKTSQKTQAKETGGPKGPEPTRYGDWEQKGRCTDF